MAKVRVSKSVEAMEKELEDVKKENRRRDSHTKVRKFPAPAPDLKSEENSKNSEEERYTFRLDEEAHDAWTMHKFGVASVAAISATIRRLHKAGMPVDTEINEDGSMTHFIMVDITLLERIVLMVREHRGEHMTACFKQGINPKSGESQWQADVKSSFGTTRYVVSRESRRQPISSGAEWKFRASFSILEKSDFRIVLVDLLEEKVSERAARRRNRKRNGKA